MLQYGDVSFSLGFILMHLRSNIDFADSNQNLIVTMVSLNCQKPSEESTVVEANDFETSNLYATTMG